MEKRRHLLINVVRYLRSCGSVQTCAWITVRSLSPKSPLQNLHSLNHRSRSDENRGGLLEAGFPQTVVTLLESYSESIPAKRPLTDPLPIHPEDLKIVKTAVGVILNTSLGYGMSPVLTTDHVLTALPFPRAGQNPSALLGSGDHYPSHIDGGLSNWLVVALPGVSFRCRTGTRVGRLGTASRPLLVGLEGPQRVKGRRQ